MKKEKGKWKNEKEGKGENEKKGNLKNYITLVNFRFQAPGHSFSPRIVIFGLNEPCTIGI